MIKEAFANFAAVHLGGGEDGLEVHGFPNGTGFNVISLERETDLLARDAGDLWIDGQAGEPVGRLAPRSLGLHGHAGEGFERFGVGFEVSTTPRDFAGETRELAEADTGRDITESVVIADGGMLIVGSGVTRLGSEEARLLGQFGIVGDEHAATASGDDFVTVKGMDAGESEGARRSFAISRAKRLGRIFDELYAMFITAGLDGRDVRRLAIQVHEDERLGSFTSLGFLFDDGTRERGIDVPAKFFGIDEDGFGPEISNGGCGRDEGQR